jgi:nucleotide-binding universal stress UspA family protein
MFSTIVVGTDGSESATEAVSAAAALAQGQGAALHLVSAYPSRPSAISVPIAGASAGTDDVRSALLADQSRDMLTALNERLGLGASVHVVPGEPADVLVDVAAEVSADLIVVGSKGMNRRILGSVPNSVAHNAPCAVLIVKTV